MMVRVTWPGPVGAADKTELLTYDKKKKKNSSSKNAEPPKFSGICFMLMLYSRYN